MRILLAKLTVAITTLLIVGLAVLFATLRRSTDEPQPMGSPPTPVPHETLIGKGRAVFISQRCQRCHSLHGTGNKHSPLDGVGERLSEHDIRRWITAPQEMKPGITKRAYQLPAEELDALVAYLKAEYPNR